jgi:hypothetical protein
MEHWDGPLPPIAEFCEIYVSQIPSFFQVPTQTLQNFQTLLDFVETHRVYDQDNVRVCAEILRSSCEGVVFVRYLVNEETWADFVKKSEGMSVSQWFSHTF